jgi:hypothetical protein
MNSHLRNILLPQQGQQGQVSTGLEYVAFILIAAVVGELVTRLKSDRFFHTIHSTMGG